MKCLCLRQPYWREDKSRKFSKSPKPNFDLYVISFICTNFEAFTTFSAIFTRIRCANSARSIFLKQDFFRAHLLFQQSQIGYMVVKHTKMEIPYTYTIIIFSNFHFISFLTLLLLNSIPLKKTLNSSAPMSGSQGTQK